MLRTLIRIGWRPPRRRPFGHRPGSTAISRPVSLGDGPRPRKSRGCRRRTSEGTSPMSTKTKRPVQDTKRPVLKAKPPQGKDETPDKDAPETPDSPLLDLSDAAVRKMIKLAKKRGYVTYEQLNAVLPSEEVTSEKIEDILAMMNEMGINTV